MTTATVRGRHRNRRRIAVAAALVLVLVAVTTVPAGSLIDRVRAAVSLEDLLAGRSPGERGAAGLIKVKLPRSLGVGRGPQQRVKSLVRSRPGGPLESFGDESPFPGGSFAPDSGVDDLIFAFDEPPGGIVLPPGGGGGGGFVSVPPAPGVIFGSNPEPTPEPTPAPPTTAPGPIPEPATWLMMMLGFGTIGGALRRARSAPRAAVRPLL